MWLKTVPPKSSVVWENLILHKTKDCVPCKLCKSDKASAWEHPGVDTAPETETLMGKEGGSFRAAQSLYQ